MPSVIVVGAQWGDEGKGKIVDLLTDQASAVVRFQGGKGITERLGRNDKRHAETRRQVSRHDHAQYAVILVPGRRAAEPRLDEILAVAGGVHLQPAVRLLAAQFAPGIAAAGMSGLISFPLAGKSLTGPRLCLLGEPWSG